MNAPMLSVHGLSVAFGGVQAVGDVSFDVAPGAIVGIIGPNGAGKSTLFDLITGYTRPDHGRVLIAGEDVTGRNVVQRVQRGLSRGFQDARLYPSLTVRETVAVAVGSVLPEPSLLGILVGRRRDRARERVLLERAEQLIDQYGLVGYADNFVLELSTGTRRMVELACVAAQRPRLLLLDEPSSGIAQREVEALGQLVRQTQRELGCAILLIEHDIPMVRSVSDVMLAFDQGRLIAQGAPHDVLDDALVVSAYLGDDSAVIERSGGAS